MNRYARPWTLAHVAATLVITIGIGSLVFAQSAQGQASSAKNGKKYVATKEIVRDKTTGQLRVPTTEETQVLVDQISALTNRSTENLSVTTSANGGKMMNLEGRFNGVVLGRALPDGTTEIRCVTTMDEAVAFLGLEESTPAPQQ
jgi:hypothetical protein